MGLSGLAALRSARGSAGRRRKPSVRKGPDDHRGRFGGTGVNCEVTVDRPPLPNQAAPGRGPRPRRSAVPRPPPGEQGSTPCQPTRGMTGRAPGAGPGAGRLLDRRMMSPGRGETQGMVSGRSLQFVRTVPADATTLDSPDAISTLRPSGVAALRQGEDPAARPRPTRRGRRSARRSRPAPRRRRPWRASAAGAPYPAGARA